MTNRVYAKKSDIKIPFRPSAEEEKSLRNILEDDSDFLSDDEDKPKIRRFSIFNFLKLHLKDCFYNIQYMLQRIFRSNHIADIDRWNMGFCMARWLYPRIKAFVAQNRHGYPGCFSEYHENEWKCREEYDQAVRDGKILGGGAEAWNNILQEILFAFEWLLEYDDWKSEKRRDAFCKKWGLRNPHEKSIENKRVGYVYDCLEPGLATCISEEPELDKKEPEKYRFRKRYVYYYDVRYDTEVIGKRAQEGFEAFGKYFQNFWD
jgi:hypothetical protein